MKTKKKRKLPPLPNVEPSKATIRDIAGMRATIEAQDKLTWKQWTHMVSALSGVHSSICENVLRAAGKLNQPGPDDDFTFPDLINNLDPDSELG